MIENRTNFKKAVDEQNLIIYTLFEDSKMSIISEVPAVMDLLPEDFKFFIENWANCAAKLNPMIEVVQHLDPV